MASSLILLTITFTFIILSSPVTKCATSAKTATHPIPPFKSIYAFGDSYTDTGNTNSATGPNPYLYVSRSPYGQTFFHHPTNRYSDGRLVIDFLAQQLSLPFLPPYLSKTADKSYGINFAVAGSTAIIYSFFVKNNLTLNRTPQSLQTQLVWFNEFLETKGCKNSITTPKECKAVFDNALIWLGEIGANDYAYTLGSSVSGTTIQKLAIGSVTRFFEVICTLFHYLMDGICSLLICKGTFQLLSFCYTLCFASIDPYPETRTSIFSLAMASRMDNEMEK